MSDNRPNAYRWVCNCCLGENEEVFSMGTVMAQGCARCNKTYMPADCNYVAWNWEREYERLMTRFLEECAERALWRGRFAKALELYSDGDLVGSGGYSLAEAVEKLTSRVKEEFEK